METHAFLEEKKDRNLGTHARTVWHEICVLQMSLGNADMETASVLCLEHPEVQMFRKRCLGDAQSFYAKASELAEAGDDMNAIKVPRLLYTIVCAVIPCSLHSSVFL